MHDFVNALTTIQRRFTSTNSNSIDQARIKLDEFEAIVEEIKRLQSVCHDQMNAIGELHREVSQIPNAV